jgi:hypothetical protein
VLQGRFYKRNSDQKEHKLFLSERFPWYKKKLPVYLFVTFLTNKLDIFRKIMTFLANFIIFESVNEQ